MNTEKLLDAIGMIDDEFVSEAKNPRPAQSRIRRTALLPLAAIIIILLSITAVAVSGVLTGILDMFRDETDGRLSAEQEKRIQESIITPEQAQTVNGVTITLKEIYGDGTNFWFYFSIDGAPIKELEEITFRRESLILEGEEERYSESIQMKELDDEAPEDEQRDIILKVSRSLNDAVMTQETIKGTLELVDLIDLTNVDPVIVEKQGEFEAAEKVAAGEWIFDFQLDNSESYQEMQVSGVTLEGNAALNTVLMATAEVKSITLRLLGMEMMYQTDPSNGTLEFEKPVIVLEDGSEIVLHEKFGGYIPDPDGSKVGQRYVSYISEGPIMLEKVSAIRYGEQVIPWQPTT